MASASEIDCCGLFWFSAGRYIISLWPFPREGTGAPSTCVSLSSGVGRVLRIMTNAFVGNGCLQLFKRFKKRIRSRTVLKPGFQNASHALVGTELEI